MDADCWGQLGMCVSVSVFKTRRLEQQQQQEELQAGVLENFAAGDLAI